MVARSGGDPELLTGEVLARVNEVQSSTKTVNVWAMQQGIVNELASSLFTDGRRFAKALQPSNASRVAAAVGAGAAVPRAAVVRLPL